MDECLEEPTPRPNVYNTTALLTDAMEEDFTYIRSAMESRRGIMLEQQKASDTSSKLCNLVRLERMMHPGLNDVINHLRDSKDVGNATLYNYIVYLETLRYSIWCNKCNTVKSLGSPLDNPKCAEPYNSYADIDEDKPNAYVSVDPCCVNKNSHPDISPAPTTPTSCAKCVDLSEQLRLLEQRLAEVEKYISSVQKNTVVEKNEDYRMFADELLTAVDLIDEGW